MRKTLTALALVFGSLAAASPALAEARALVVGINEYDQGTRLYGAVADARDIAASLRRFGLQDVTMLTDRAATRAAIEDAWKSMVARASPGDTVVFTYAGHGYHEPDLNGDEALITPGDDRDENFLLSAFSPARPLERLIDDDIDLWLKEAADKGLKVMFVADSCHSGTVHRGGGEGRTGSFAEPVLRERNPSFAPPAALAAPDLLQMRAGVFFVSAIEQSRPVKEVRIDGEVRGALSYAFARALDGAADYNKDGALDHHELGHYLETVSVARDDEAKRTFWPTNATAPQIVLTRAANVPAPPPPPPAQGSEVRLALRGEGAPSLPGFNVVTEAPDLTYDLGAGKLLDGDGATVAENVRPLAVELQPILDKYRLVKLAQEMATRSPMRAILSPSSGSYVIGSPVRVEVAAGGRPWLTVFNLANKGEIQNIFPHHPHDAAHRLDQQPYGVDAQAQEPPGADHLIVLASDAAPTALREALKTGADARRLQEILEGMSAAGGVSAQLVPFYAVRR